MKTKRANGITLVICTIVLLAGYIPTVAFGASFYAGKTIRIVVGYSPGGSADADARLIARYLGKHIPGNPRLIVQNVPGAGGLVAINLAYSRAKPDGLSIFQLGSGHFLLQLTGSDVVKFDVTKMPVLGAWTRSTFALWIRSDTPYKSVEAIRDAKTPPVIATHGTATGIDLFNLAWQSGLGIKFKLVPGYESAEQNAALERGEVDGRTDIVGGVLRRSPHWITENFAPAVVQAGPDRDPRIPNVPTVYELSPNPGALFETLNGGLSVSRPYVLPPGTPPDRVKILRQAWESMLKDKEFIAGAEKLKWQVVPTPYDKVESFYKKVMAETPPEVVKILKEQMP